METIKTKISVGSDRHLSLQLPQDLPPGDYEVLVVLSPKTTQKPEKKYPLLGLPIALDDDFDEPMPELWEALEE
ncbi:hypothetical protein [Lyngbya sp. CCY1209]|jgi:hypothetical protein|uniref:hypothetical protein n=1 Tax=Lyngbya sp. CCY1209 TaxID=2886103 RepID=UPI002D21625C|nr:hypothetical protein [Lyngbya sp. CCY1209]MEB3885216.1 hypothetical protein [Lyngbya sp. CCY1209]